MTDPKKYEAQDDDLPVELFEGVELRTSVSSQSSDASARVAVQVHFPSERERAKERERYEREVRRSNREAVNSSRKKYLKAPKKKQMFLWLLALEPMFHVLNPREQDLCQKLLWKFRRYGPERAKWITQGQYEFLLDIASKNLTMPGVSRCRVK